MRKILFSLLAIGASNANATRIDFDSVAGLSTPTSVVTIDNALASLPAETLYTGTATSINVRRPDNPINAYFGGMFTSNFLVLGDNTGSAAGNPTGGERSISFPVSVDYGNISFSYAFAGLFSGVSDWFSVALGATELLRLDGPGAGVFSTSVNGQFNGNLTFTLHEATGSTSNTAVAIDNIEIPEPGTVWLLGSGLAAFSRKRLP